MKKNYGYLACHFHRVEALTWLRVRTMLNELLLGRVQSNSQYLTYQVSDEDFETIRDFVEQMDIAYLHPRRDSYHLQLLQTIYSTFTLPKKSPFLSCLPTDEKKPKSRKEPLTASGRPAQSFTNACLCFVAVLCLFLIASHIDYLFNQL